MPRKMRSPTKILCYTFPSTYFTAWVRTFFGLLISRSSYAHHCTSSERFYIFNKLRHRPLFWSREIISLFPIFLFAFSDQCHWRNNYYFFASLSSTVLFFTLYGFDSFYHSYNLLFQCLFLVIIIINVDIDVYIIYIFIYFFPLASMTQ